MSFHHSNIMQGLTPLPYWNHLNSGNTEMSSATIKTPFEKRIKRHLIGRKRQFFASTAPGLETICLEELKDLLPADTPMEIMEGGIAFEGRLHDCYLANLNLRTANRLLMRIESFHAANFRKLKKHLADVSWELFILPGAPTRIRVVTRHSRLYHKDAVAGLVQESIASRLAQNEFPLEPTPEPTITQQIFVRLSDDHVTLSIDSSGDLLHKRGIKPRAAKAPIRETLAAAALKLSAYTGAGPLLDPMCGSGTFSIEAALIALKIPSGSFRNFAFMEWPSFQPKRWEYMKQAAEKKIVRTNTPFIFASDRDHRAVCELEESVTRHGISNIVSVSNRDFFDLLPIELTNRPGLVTLNPPYGRRLGSRRESDALFLSVCERLKKEYKGWKFILISLNPRLAGMVPFRSTTHMLPHGGLKIALMTGRIPGNNKACKAKPVSKHGQR